MEQVERIGSMEERLRRARAAVDALTEALEAYKKVLPDIHALEEYLQSEEWRRDFEADEAGTLPPDLERGVLSEDGIYDLLEENDLLRLRFSAAAEGFADTEPEEE